MQPIRHEETKSQRDRRLDWEGRVEEKTSEPEGGFGLGTFFLCLIGAGVLAVAAWLGISVSTSQPKAAPELVAKDKGEGADNPAAKTGDGSFSAYYEYTDLKEKIGQVVRAFFAAETAAELEKWVSEKEKVGAYLLDYYRETPPEPKEVANVLLSLKYGTPEGQPEFYLVKVSMNLGEEIPLGVEAGPEGIFVDWESHVGYNPVKFEDVGNGEENAQTFRAIMRKALFFDDRPLMESVAGAAGTVVELDLTGREDPVFAFVADAKDFAPQLKQMNDGGKDHAVMIRLSRRPLLPDNYAIMESFKQIGWVNRARPGEELDATTLGGQD